MHLRSPLAKCRMVKFQKQFEDQLVPEWKNMYCNYKLLKNEIREIRSILQDSAEQAAAVPPSPLGAVSHLVPSSWIHKDKLLVVHKRHVEATGEDIFETELMESQPMHYKRFFQLLDEQLNKVNSFYKMKEKEYMERESELRTQMKALIELQKSSNAGASSKVDAITQDLERSLTKTPSSVKSSKSQVVRADKMLKKAYIEFYRGLKLLASFRSLNTMAFVKILKKFDKLTAQSTSDTYLRAVEISYFSSSDKIPKLMAKVEAIFTQHFADGNRKEALVYLRAVQRVKQTQRKSFALGLFTGCSWSLLLAFILLLILASNTKLSSREKTYLKSAFPVFSTIMLFLLHIYMYGCNVYTWSRVRINYAFIFEFAPGTELKYQDVLLLSTGLTSILIMGMIAHLAVYTGESNGHVKSELIPFIVFMILVFLLLSPFNFCFKSSRVVFLRATWHNICAPLYKVVLLDFFIGDQFTSQVTALRNLGYISCYYGGGFYKTQRTEACTNNEVFKAFQYVLAVLPFWARLMQCWRRWLDEHQGAHIANGGKYLSAMVAMIMKLTYSRFDTRSWLVVFVLCSVFATAYQLYWDLVVDWGLLQPKSVNPWLRDRLILKNKAIYFLSMILNVMLRLAWLYAVIHIPYAEIDHLIIDFVFAALEVMRRGHWNFYRLENEHLNNVGRYRAVRAVPLPFKRDIDDIPS